MRCCACDSVISFFASSCVFFCSQYFCTVTYLFLSITFISSCIITMPAHYEDWLCYVTALLALKFIALDVLIMRARLCSGTFSWKEDSIYQNFKGISNIAMLGFIKWGTSSEDVIKFQNVRRNCVENEVWFVVVAFLYGKQHERKGTEVAVEMRSKLMYYAVARFVHTFFFLFSLQPFRTLAFAAGFQMQIAITWALFQMKFKVGQYALDFFSK